MAAPAHNDQISRIVAGARVYADVLVYSSFATSVVPTRVTLSGSGTPCEQVHRATNPRSCPLCSPACTAASDPVGNGSLPTSARRSNTDLQIEGEM